MYNKILVPLDGSQGSLKALEYAGNLVKLKHSTQVTLLTVNNYHLENHIYRGISVELPADVETQIKDSYEDILINAKSLMSKIGIEAETKVLLGSVAERIAEFANEEGFDLVVMGSRGLNMIKGFLLGSVSDRVLHLTRCSVLIIK